MRVSVVGTSGSGKTTFAGALAAALGARHIELDAINWQADWKDLNKYDPDEFIRRVTTAIAAESWVSCGNYGKVRLAEKVYANNFWNILHFMVMGTQGDVYVGLGSGTPLGQAPSYAFGSIRKLSEADLIGRQNTAAP